VDKPATRTNLELDSYVQLVRALLPRMASFAVFDAIGELFWSNEMAVDEDAHEVVKQAITAAQSSLGAPGLALTDGEPRYVFWLWRDGVLGAGEGPFASILVRCRTVNEGELRSFTFVHALVRPAIEILRRELLGREQLLGLANELAEHDQHLDMLLAVSGGSASGEESSGDELKSILKAAVDHVEAGLAAIIVPERGIVLVRQHPEHSMDASLVARAHKHLMNTAQMRREAVIVNQMKLQIGTEQRAFRVLACPIAKPDGRGMGVLALFRPQLLPEFTTRQGRLGELLARRVSAVVGNSYDALTGLLNRPAFEARVQGVLRQTDSAQRWWSALAIDTNRLHVINDTHGMHIGDRVLSLLGELLRTRLPPGSVAARMSGDRFAVLLPASLDDAARFAESLRAGAEQLGAGIGDGSLSISISVGVAAVEPRAEELTHAFAAAETACKAANDRGRNRVEVFQENDESIVRRYTDINMATDLTSAMNEGRLCLNAQLLLPVRGGSQKPHFEILLRMLGTDGAIVGPDHFLSAAQRYQLMPEIDRWVLRESLRQLQPHLNLLQDCPVVFTINVSGQSLRDDAFIEFLEAQVRQSGINPQALCFELTEGSAVGNIVHAEKVMNRMRRLGCGVALDDFGTGLSSLSYLRSLPLTMLKIDGSFVRDVLKDPKAESTIQAIAQLARAMSLTTVAEYVETDEIRQRVGQLGVDYAQGFAIGRPTPLPDVLEQLPLYAAASGAADTGSFLIQSIPLAV
jgi:diguanylate cyclase (GGDEF)-like protein